MVNSIREYSCYDGVGKIPITCNNTVVIDLYIYLALLAGRTVVNLTTKPLKPDKTINNFLDAQAVVLHC